METLLSPQEEEALRTSSLISYILHLIVAVSAVVPGAQMGPALLLVALVLDMVKKSDAQGTWHATHFRYRIRSVLWAAGRPARPQSRSSRNGRRGWRRSE